MCNYTLVSQISKLLMEKDMFQIQDQYQVLIECSKELELSLIERELKLIYNSISGLIVNKYAKIINDFAILKKREDVKEALNFSSLIY